VAQLNDSSHLATDGSDGHQLTGALVPREHDLNGYTAIGAPMLAPVWQDQAASGVSLTKMAHSFRRRWLLAMFMGLLLGIPAALATWLIFPKQFEVEAMLQFRNLERVQDNEGYMTVEAEKQWRESQPHLIKSQMMLTRTLGEPKVANLSLIRAETEPIYFLQRSISVFSPKDSDLVFIRMVGEDAREMVEIVRTLTDKYILHATDTTGAERTRKIDRLENELKRNQKQLESKNETKMTIAFAAGAEDSRAATTKKNQLESEVVELRKALEKAKDRLWTAEEEVAKIKARHLALDSGTYPEALLMDEVRDDPQLYELRQNTAEITDLYEHAKSVAKYPNDPAVLRYAYRLKTLKEKEDRLIAELREVALAKLRWGPEGGQESLDRAEAQVAKLVKETKSLETDLAETRDSLSKMTTDNVQLVNLESEIKRIEENGAKLSAQLHKAQLEGTLPPKVAVLEDAEVPEGSTLMYRVILTSFLGILCFCVGVGGVVLLEYTKQRVSTLNDIGYGGLGIRVLGTVPNLARLSRQAASKNGEANGAVSGILAESIDSVRTMLLSNKGADAPKIILVTSADEHEGKTTVASHLAASLARAGRRTLLVDGDLRKPAIHMLFDMPLSAGVCEVLRGEASIDAVVHPAQVEGMWVMLAGQCDQQAIASLAKDSAAALFRKLRADYEFVVIDSGPALAFADTMLIGSHADAAVMAILRDVSQIPKVYEARERLEAIGMQVLGGVVGGVTTNGSRNYALMN
jgi:succinoglycan biosynthesis transport protein ExoP